ncbi:MAG: alpha-L-fucosidase [Pseudomonadales bacterium]
MQLGCGAAESPADIFTSATVSSSETSDRAIQDWQDMRFGLFIHWGVYSLPAGVWQGQQIEKLGEQIQRHADISMADYEKLARQFNPVNFDADEIVQLAKRAGMRYIVLTAKHHDGFAMFDSAHTDFDIVDFTQYKRDILKQLADACARHGLKLGIYYSTPDWHFNGPEPERNPQDGKMSVFAEVSKANEDYQVAQLEELLSNYGDIAQVFFDMGEPSEAQSKRFRDTVKGLQPNTLINGRIMNNQGDFLTMQDNHVPDVPISEFPWESPGTFYHTWGYKSWVKGDPLPQQVRTQVRKLSSISSMGGNFLLNIGPKSDGSVVAYERDVLEGVGQWVDVHREAIFGTGLNPFNRLAWGQASTAAHKLYLHIYQWPKDDQLLVPGLQSTVTKAYALSAREQALSTRSDGTNLQVDLSALHQDPSLTIVVLEYEGDLSIVPVHSAPNEKGELVLKGELATRHGKYGRQSYRAMLKDFYRSWYIAIPEPGDYKAEIIYKMRYDQKRFVLQAESDSVQFNLQGNGARKAAANSVDGNERIAVSRAVGGSLRQAEVGVVHFDHAGIQQVYLRPGQNFELLARSRDFNQQDQKYRAMNIDIEAIRLLPIANDE